MGHAVSRNLVAELLATAGYSLQANRKTREGTRHPDRDAQFRYIHQQVRPAGAPVPSGGPAPSFPSIRRRRIWRGISRPRAPSGTRKGSPSPVRVHDFIIPAKGKAIPYGVYDSHAECRAALVIRVAARGSSRRMLGAAMARGCAGRNGNSSSWPTGRLAITVYHFPPGTSKWNKIE